MIKFLILFFALFASTSFAQETDGYPGTGNSGALCSLIVQDVNSNITPSYLLSGAPICQCNANPGNGATTISWIGPVGSTMTVFMVQGGSLYPRACVCAGPYCQNDVFMLDWTDVTFSTMFAYTFTCTNACFPSVSFPYTAGMTWDFSIQGVLSDQHYLNQNIYNTPPCSYATTMAIHIYR